MELFIVAGELPYFFAILVEVVPPPEANQKPACHIFDCPEIQGAQYYHNNESVDVSEEVADNEIASVGKAVH